MDRLVKSGDILIPWCKQTQQEHEISLNTSTLGVWSFQNEAKGTSKNLEINKPKREVSKQQSQDSVLHHNTVFVGSVLSFFGGMQLQHVCEMSHWLLNALKSDVKSEVLPATSIPQA